MFPSLINSHFSFRLDWDRWVMMGMIGVTIGIVGFLLHNVIHLIAEVKWERANVYFHVSTTFSIIDLCALNDRVFF